MNKILLLGGTQHLRAVLIDGFDTPLSHNNAEKGPERYHRAIYHPPCDNGVVDRVWYVYVTDEYQTSSAQLKSADIFQALEDHEIGAHITSIPFENLKHERYVL
jgi:hypothetical protein